ncbi:hypothetical protein JCGZ_11073 [Jatropha curcas]|uniref:Late embryogenesis abundant protein LEA-2 subgroup domain-containing protein n=1 Tax=Jatropha curcas TaxID=180498 RepID=A0A067KHM5_JATCU|nr:uncharacterized protein LOC119370744 [Jatropha curcas]KDP34523.1 hypothetical protein JCGZ_11073 [Jatropha curcas]
MSVFPEPTVEAYQPHSPHSHNYQETTSTSSHHRGSNPRQITTAHGNEEFKLENIPPIYIILFFSVLMVAVLTVFGMTTHGRSQKIKKLRYYFEAPTFLIESAKVYPFDISSSNITANWNIIVYMGYPDTDSFVEQGFYYQNMEASVLLKNETVYSKKIGNIYKEYERGGDFKMVDVFLESSLASINQTVAEAVMAEKRENGVVTFSFELNCSGTNYPAYIDTRNRRKMTVLCKDLKIRFLANTNAKAGALVNPYGPIPCDVFVFL